MQAFKRLPILSVALLLILGLSGCVWLRLLELKSQLADFDHHVRVEVADRHFILHLLKPVVTSEDFLYLTKLHPTRRETLPQGHRDYLVFHFDPAATKHQATKTISYTLSFDAEQKLTDFDFSPLFLEIAPPAFLEASIRALGSGKVDQGKKQLKVDPEHLPKLTAQLPHRKDVLNAMGPPAEDFVYEGLRILLYRFKADAEPVEPEYEKRRLAEAKLFFDPATDELVRLAGKFAGLKLAVDYRKFSQFRESGGK